MVVVTGATGFLGAHLVMSLLLEGYAPTAIRRAGSSMEEFESIARYRLGNQPELLDKVVWKTADITDIISLDEALAGAEYVFHCAAKVAFKGRDNSMRKINVEGTANVVNACLRAKVRKLIYASSTAAIGRTEKEDVITEEAQWVDNDANTAYAQTKHDAELEVWRGMEEGLDVLVFNPGILLGPGKWDKGSCRLFENVRKGFRFYTQGINGFVGVEDVARAMIQFGFGDLKNKRYLMVSESVSYKRLFGAMARAMEVVEPSIEIKPSYVPWIKFPIWLYSKISTSGNLSVETLKTSLKKHTYDSSAIRSLGFEFTPIEEVIRQTVNVQHE